MHRKLVCLPLAFAGSLLLAAAPVHAQTPDLLYYEFDEPSGTDTANSATPGVGANPASVGTHVLSGAGGQFGGALESVGGAGATSFVNTGWATQFSGDFTIAFWLDMTGATALNPFMYLLGDLSAGSLRCFTNGAAGVGNLTLRSTPWPTGVVVPGGADMAAPHHIAFVYAASAGELRGYRDGVRVVTATVAAASYSGTGPFRVGAYSTTSPMASGVKLDEFRMYSSALSDAQIAATWNVSLGGPPAPLVYCTSGTSSNGCSASIGSSGVASASGATPLSISVSAVEGQRQGLIFYGIDNSGFAPNPWGTGFFCVKPPVQRSFPQSSGGTVGACDGALTLDWNAFHVLLPGALGQPFAAGDSIYLQGWFRDPASSPVTAFSNALEVTLGP